MRRWGFVWFATALAACSSSSNRSDGPADTSESNDAADGAAAEDLGDADADAPIDDSYRECSEAAPCDSTDECVLGLCLPRCGAGPACVEGEACWEEGCRAECDEAHPCDQAYTCEEGACVDDPCGHPEFWTLRLESDDLPVTVHYRDDAEEDEARVALEAVEHAWDIETRVLGFDPPVLDDGACGPDERFDVFIWRTYRGGSADEIGPVESTEWDDIMAYLLLDPWGPYGGEFLAATTAHELNHAMQAVHDWNETAILFEMTSQYVEDQVYDDDNNWKGYLYDFQGTPWWAFDHNDDYETWYFYGSALYLFYLRDRFFQDDPAFIGRLWAGTRNPPGDNEPDFEDVLDDMLGEEAGISFMESLVEFSRWRWYTGRRDDGDHFEEGGTFPENAEVALAARVRAGAHTIEREGPEMTGVEYIEVYRENGDPTELSLGFEGAEGVQWVVQVVPGAADGDGEELDVRDGQATLVLGGLRSRTLVILALPPDAEAVDPETRTFDRYPYAVTLE